MSHPRTDVGQRCLAKERETKARLMAETEGMADCGKSSHGMFVRGCRCDECRAANNAYERDRNRRKAYGRSLFVDAEPVRQHVRWLKSKDYTVREIEHLTGCAHTTMHSLMVRHWRTGRPTERVNKAFADKVMALGTTDKRRWLTPGHKVRCDMGRQVDEFYRNGLSIAEMARTTGLDRQVLDRARKRPSAPVRASSLHAWAVALPALRRKCYGERNDALERMGV